MAQYLRRPSLDDEEIMKWISKIFNDIYWWWRMRKHTKCDFCEKTFTLGEMNACSCNMWLCDSCLSLYIKEMNE